MFERVVAGSAFFSVLQASGATPHYWECNDLTFSMVRLRPWGKHIRRCVVCCWWVSGPLPKFAVLATHLCVGNTYLRWQHKKVLATHICAGDTYALAKYVLATHICVGNTFLCWQRIYVLASRMCAVNTNVLAAQMCYQHIYVLPTQICAGNTYNVLPTQTMCCQHI